MLAKASVVMFPVILLLHAWWRRGRVTGRDMMAAVPFFVVSLGLGLVSVWFQASRAISNWNLPRETVLGRLAGAGFAIRFYLGKCLFPSNLMPIYPGWHLHSLSASLFLPWGILAALVIVLVRVGTAPGRFQTAARVLLFGMGWFIINLLPVLGFIPMSYQHVAPVADHFCYVSLAGLVGLAVAGIGVLTASSRPVIWIAAAGIAVLFAAESRRYAAIFSDQETMWAYNLLHNRTSRAVRVNQGFILHHDGRLEDAIRSYEEAVRLDPEDAQAEDELAGIYVEQNRAREAAEHYDRAIAHYRRALDIDPSLFETRRSLAKTLANSGHTREAVGQYEDILRRKPDDAETENNLGKALATEGRAAEAMAHFKRALTLSPDFAEAENSIGMAFFSDGRLEEGLRHLDRAVRLDPRLAEAENNVGLVLVRTGRPLEAIPHLERALTLKPVFGRAENNLGFALAAVGRLQAALGHFERAVQLVPDDAGFHLNLAILLEMLGRTREAESHFEEAVRLKPDLEVARRELERLKGGRKPANGR
jgi:tetratricopeptide (TPR) repeat protein